ncbi:ATP-binding cassette domain-containing protein [Microbacterium insulae]|uniref:ATP-binding cassette domain-containing protein n=1 Tax=Microbacterium insulae TaxID=483014 RepID=A0ABW3AGF5_9MICO
MIEVERLSKSYGSRRALDDVSFVAPRGRVTGFVGPNGAGKSTVMRIAAGLCEPDTGTVRVLGAPFTRAERPAATMGVFLSAEGIPAAATARGFLEYACDSQGFSRSRASDALELVGLAGVASSRVRSFSLGMRQRLGIAAATLGRPRVLLLDEPVNGLDPDGIQWVRSFLKHAADSGATVLLSSHHMAELALVAQHVVMLNEGRVVTEGPIEDVVAGTSSDVYAVSPDPASFRRALEAENYDARPDRGGFLIADADPLEIGRLAYTAGVGVTHLERVSRSLEDTYFEILTSTEQGVQA